MQARPTGARRWSWWKRMRHLEMPCPWKWHSHARPVKGQESHHQASVHCARISAEKVTVSNFQKGRQKKRPIRDRQATTRHLYFGCHYRQKQCRLLFSVQHRVLGVVASARMCPTPAFPFFHASYTFLHAKGEAPCRVGNQLGEATTTCMHTWILFAYALPLNS